VVLRSEFREEESETNKVIEMEKAKPKCFDLTRKKWRKAESR